MAAVLHRTTKAYQRYANTSEQLNYYPKSDWIHNPVLPDAGPSKYWNIRGDTVTPMSAAERQAVDDAEKQEEMMARRSRAKDLVTGDDDLSVALRALFRVMSAHTGAPSNVPATIGELMTEFASIVDSGAADEATRTRDR